MQIFRPSALLTVIAQRSIVDELLKGFSATYSNFLRKPFRTMGRISDQDGALLQYFLGLGPALINSPFVLHPCSSICLGWKITRFKINGRDLAFTFRDGDVLGMFRPS